MSKNHYKLERVSGQPVCDAELLADLLRVARENNIQSVSQSVYEKYGLYNVTTISRRFGSWNKASIRAGLELVNEVYVSDDRLFENILSLWQRFGRQPRRSELSSPYSQFSQSPYNRRFGTWTQALQSFVDFANESDTHKANDNVRIEVDGKTRVRDPSLRLRYNVLKRDSFSCQHCGASPARTSGVELHIDHILPWSKGGLTTIDNLQTLCSACNLGKGNSN